MLIVPLQPVASQTLQVNLANQLCQINVYQKLSGLFMDLYLAGQTDPVIAGVLCLNLNRIVRSLYLGFVGDFTFIDSEGDANPTYDGLGGRFNLAYLAAGELPPGQG